MPEYESPRARYRELAQEALEVANTFAPGEQREAFLQVAQVWHRLADRAMEACYRLPLQTPNRRSDGKPHRTMKILSRARWCCGRVAARGGARAASGEDPAHDA